VSNNMSVDITVVQQL